MALKHADDSGRRQLQVAAERAGQRVDNFLLGNLKGVPRPLIYRLLRKGQIRLNDRRAKPATKLAAGDRLSVPRLRLPAQIDKAPARASLPEVIHEDRDFLVFDKPAGLAVHGGSGLSFGLIELARQLRRDSDLELAHRLDRDTSGLIVLAKRRAGLRCLHEQLRSGRVVKIYQAVVLGTWAKEHSRLLFPLLRIPAAKGGRRVVVADDGLACETRSWCIAQNAAGALVEVELVTGRTHQARAHLAHAGLPVLGDGRYGSRPRNLAAGKAGVKGLYLHARRLVFTDVSGERIELEARVPRRFAAAMQWLDELPAGGD